MAALNPSDSSFGYGCFRARPSNDQEDPCLLSEGGEPSRKCRREVSRVREQSKLPWKLSGLVKVRREEGFDRTESMLDGLGAGWTASFLAKIYPTLSRYLMKEFLQAVVEVSIVELLALFVTFGAENFVKGPAVLLTEGVQNLRLDGLLTLIALTHGNLGGLMILTRYPEQMRENVWKFDVKRATDSWNKIQDKRFVTYSYPVPPAALEQERMKQSRGRKTCDDMLGACPCELI